MLSSDEELKQCQALLLKTFKDFDAMCRKNGLQYYAAYGTALGAVRHHGFIPWDDDIDVHMPRRDYNKLMAMKDNFKGTKYEVIDIRDKGYYLNFAKFCVRDSSLIEKKGQPNLGFYIDIFPLDYYRDNARARFLKKTNKLYLYCWVCYGHARRQYSWADIKQDIREKDYRTLKIMALDKTLFQLLRFPAKWFIKIVGHLTSTEKPSDKVRWFSSNPYFNRIYSKEIFGKGVQMPFGDFTTVLPADYDTYLTSEYGDYMTPPPVEERPSHHSHYFVDFNRRLSDKEIVMIMSRRQKEK